MATMISIVGKSASGKTTLIEKLIKELKSRGLRIGIIKHTHHGFDMDKKGKDSWRHQQAGADTVAVAGIDQLALVKKQKDLSLDTLATHFQDVDLVMTEGYKTGDRPKIEVCRAARNKTPLCLNDPLLKALVTDADITANVPVFGLEEIEKIADFIQTKFLKGVDS